MSGGQGSWGRGQPRRVLEGLSPPVMLGLGLSRSHSGGLGLGPGWFRVCPSRGSRALKVAPLLSTKARSTQVWIGAPCRYRRSHPASRVHIIYPSSLSRAGHRRPSLLILTGLQPMGSEGPEWYPGWARPISDSLSHTHAL